jgi:O-antigen biosynthesis protein
MDAAPSVEIIVLNWNGQSLLPDCLSALTKLDYPQYTIWLVDNASSDDSVSLVRQQFPQVRIIVNKENLGFGRGINVGLRQTTADIAVLLNNDVVVRPDWLRELAASFQQDPGLGIAGCKLLFGDEQTIQHAGGRLTYPLAFSQHDYYQEKDIGQADEMRQVDYVTGAALAISRAVRQKIGLLDEAFQPFYYEEVDYCYRARAAGFRVLYVPRATAVHHENSSMKQFNQLRATAFHKNRLLFALKHYTPAQFCNDFLPAELARLQAVTLAPERLAVRRACWHNLTNLATVLAGKGETAQLPAVRAALLKLRAACLAWQEVNYMDITNWPGQALIEAMDFQEPQFHSDKPIIGPLIVALRRQWNDMASRWYVWDLIQQQLAYNQLAGTLLDGQHSLIQGNSDEITSLIQQLQEMQQEMVAANESLQRLDQRLARLEAHLGLVPEDE